jgi:hypothetical protein
MTSEYGMAVLYVVVIVTALGVGCQLEDFLNTFSPWNLLGVVAGSGLMIVLLTLILPT